MGDTEKRKTVIKRLLEDTQEYVAQGQADEILEDIQNILLDIETVMDDYGINAGLSEMKELTYEEEKKFVLYIFDLLKKEYFSNYFLRK